MSFYQVCKIAIEQNNIMQTVKFDSKEDAEHYAKNESMRDDKHQYEVQKNDKGNFLKIKSYLQGQEE